MSLDRIAGLVRMAAADADVVTTLQKQPAQLQVPLNLTAAHLQVLEAGRQASGAGVKAGSPTQPSTTPSPAARLTTTVRAQSAPIHPVTRVVLESSSNGQLLPPEGSGQPPSPVTVQAPGPTPGPSPSPAPHPVPGPIPEPAPTPIPQPGPIHVPGPVGPIPGKKPSGRGPFGPVPSHPEFPQPSGPSGDQGAPCSQGSGSPGLDQLLAACGGGDCCCLQIAAMVATVTETAHTAITAITAIARKR